LRIHAQFCLDHKIIISNEIHQDFIALHDWIIRKNLKKRNLPFHIDDYQVQGRTRLVDNRENIYAHETL
jgi:hypothetical protein